MRCALRPDLQKPVLAALVKVAGEAKDEDLESVVKKAIKVLSSGKD